jgi:hypothetical protein
MTRLLVLLFFLGLICCQTPSSSIPNLQSRIDSLEQKLSDTFKPGFGEFMSSIQMHHAKLWFAGIQENWKLAEFESHEIKEGMEAIQNYQKERTESERIPMIYPALDSINYSILQKNSNLFKKNYNLLTNTCNDCHRAVKFEYNVVKIPEFNPFSNQEFKSIPNVK